MIKTTTLFSKKCAVKEELIKKSASKPGLRGKVDATCIKCRYDSRQKGTWRKQVGECTCIGCPLYPVRPRTKNNQT